VREPGEQVAEVVRAAFAVPGVTAVRVEPDARGGPALLRLELSPDADEQEVADAVDARLRDQPQVFSGVLPSPAARRAPAESPTPRPQAPGGDLSGAGPLPGLERLVLERVQQVTETMTTTSTVVLRNGEDRHTGVADGAATVGGSHRSLAAATARAVESAASGKVRLDVEAADVLTVASEATAVVLLTVLSRRGTERLTGAVLVGADPARAVVKAVLTACNRRVSRELVAQ